MSIETVVSTIVAKTASGAIQSVFSSLAFWNSQRRATAETSDSAMAMYEHNSMDAELQATNVPHDGVRHEVKQRRETHLKIRHASALLRRYFGENVADAFDRVVAERHCRHTVPHIPYYNAKGKFQALLDEAVGAA